MRIEVVNTGTELLLGKVVNTHVSYFGQELFKLGLRVQRQTTIPDGDDIREVLESAFSRSDAILITGGLGPTSDDLTREIVADMLGRELILDQGILEELNEFFKLRGLSPDRTNDRQAMVPEGAEVLVNPHGTAPGLYVPASEVDKSPHLFLLPGPPRELKPMFKDLVYPRLAEMGASDGASGVWHNFRIYGVGESSIAGKLDPMFEADPDVELGYCARLGEVDVRLIGSPEAVDSAAAKVREIYVHDIIAEAEDPIEKVVVDLLCERGETVATAESCTGGQIASTITNVPGSSRIIERGYITYANEAKTDVLGVDSELIREHGAVSAAVVKAMAEGCLKVSGADHAIAVSGIAGPDGGTDEKPVGTVYLAIASSLNETFVKRYFSPTDRISFKLRITRLALDFLRRRLLGFPLD
tara:strand:+ start:3882 stop:5126 length:1245 start_codon:yes stop_codon:yes gene_type:complete